MITKFIEPTRKTGEESFRVGKKSLDVNLLNFWQWANSDLLNNVDRGKLAEFIVATSLGISNNISATWDSYDLEYMGKGIEIKSSAYLQSWYQEKESAISFGIRQTTAWDAKTGIYDTEQKRQSYLYVFCLLKHKDKLTVNPLNLEQWEFYVISTSTLNELFPVQKSVSLNSLLKNGFTPCDYNNIRYQVEQIMSI